MNSAIPARIHSSAAASAAGLRTAGQPARRRPLGGRGRAGIGGEGLNQGLNEALNEALNAGLNEGLNAGLNAGLNVALNESLTAALMDGLSAGQAGRKNGLKAASQSRSFVRCLDVGRPARAALTLAGPVLARPSRGTVTVSSAALKAG